MGLASAIKARWFGRRKAPAAPPAPPPHPWTLRLVGVTGRADAFKEGSLVTLPVTSAGKPTAIELCYLGRVVLTFPVSGDYCLTNGDCFNFDLSSWLPVTDADAKLGRAVRSLVGGHSA